MEDEIDCRSYSLPLDTVTIKTQSLMLVDRCIIAVSSRLLG